MASKVNLTSDAMVTILVMVRAMLNYESKDSADASLPEWMKEYPVTITQFLFYLYHNLADLMPAFMTSDVLTGLAGTLFPNIDSKSGTLFPPPDDSVFPNPYREIPG